MRGSSLIEIVIVTGVMALVLTAIVAGLTLSLKTNADSEYRSRAVQRTQEAMEVFRRERTVRGWDVFISSFTSGATYCLAELPAPTEEFTEGACFNEDSIVISGVDFYREAVVTVDNSDPTDPQLRVELTTSWDSGSGERTVNIVQSFQQLD